MHNLDNPDGFAHYAVKHAMALDGEAPQPGPKVIMCHPDARIVA